MKTGEPDQKLRKCINIHWNTVSYVQIQRGDRGSGHPPPLKIMASSAHQQNDIEMAFCWQDNDGLLRILVRTHYSLCKIWLKQNKI